MKKWITMIVLGGALSTLVLGGSAATPAAGTAAAAAMDGSTEPCPTCCPVHICGWNGPSFDGTTPTTAAPSRP